LAVYSLQGATLMYQTELSTLGITEGAYFNLKLATDFSEGTDAVISCQNKELIASVVSDEIFGQKNDKEDEPVIYLQLMQPDPTLKEGARGKITVILEESRDTLYVIKSAVGTVDGEAFVYTVDEDGLLIMQKVKTGLEDGKYIEIIDGLKENDSIIIK